MGISQFNRSNPMVILMRRVNDEFTNESIKATKSAIRRAIVQVILLLASSILIFIKSFTKLDGIPRTALFFLVIILVITIITMIFMFYAVVLTGANPKMKEINDMIYGETYSVADVNNEDVLKVINDLEFMLGKLDATTTLILFWHGIILATQLLTISFLIRL